jgi:predicted nucleic acid-binding Zn ribbon protein
VVCRILLYLRDRRCTLILTFVAVLLLVIVVVVLNVLQEVGLSTR